MNENFYFLESQRRAAENVRNQAKIDELSNNLLHNKIQNDQKAANLRDELEGIENQRDYYRNLLSKPMEEIAEANGNFKATFEKQQEIIADWIVSQKAFRELALDLGQELGLTKDQMRKRIEDKEHAVLTDNTKYDNNASKHTGDNVLVELTEKTIAQQKSKAGII